MEQCFTDGRMENSFFGPPRTTQFYGGLTKYSSMNQTPIRLEIIPPKLKAILVLPFSYVYRSSLCFKPWC
jgi:hypothetical protein